MKRLLLALVVFASACAPRLYVNVLRPAPVNLGAAKKLSLFESQGRQSAREELGRELKAQTQSTGYFSLLDRTDEGLMVRINGQSVLPSAPPAPDEVALRIDVAEWNADRESQPTGEKDKQGNPVTKDVWKSRVTLVVTAFNAAGRTFVVEKEYKATGQDEKDEDAAILSAARDAVTAVLDDVTPTYVQRAIQLDDSEEAQRPIIDLARSGDVLKAIELEKELLAKSPHNAAGIFNLAVLTDSQGLYRDALGLYEQAIELAETKELYREVKEECAKRLADADALAN
jgi:hypothetical protein